MAPLSFGSGYRSEIGSRIGRPSHAHLVDAERAREHGDLDVEPAARERVVVGGAGGDPARPASNEEPESKRNIPFGPPIVSYRASTISPVAQARRHVSPAGESESAVAGPCSSRNESDVPAPWSPG